MSYIDQSSYKDLLNKFAEGSKKQELKENYIDLRPINSLQEEVPTKMSHIYAKYPEGMYESEMEEDIEMEGNAFTKGLAKTPEGGTFKVGDKEIKDTSGYDDPSVKDEGLHGDGKLTGPSGYKLENLTLDERTELKSYVESMKTTRKAIDELLEKAKMRMEGGDNMGTLTMPMESTDKLEGIVQNLADRFQGQSLEYSKLEQIADALSSQGHEINARYLAGELKKKGVEVK